MVPNKESLSQYGALAAYERLAPVVAKSYHLAHVAGLGVEQRAVLHALQHEPARWWPRMALQQAAWDPQPGSRRDLLKRYPPAARPDKNVAWWRGHKSPAPLQAPAAEAEAAHHRGAGDRHLCRSEEEPPPRLGPGSGPGKILTRPATCDATTSHSQ